MLWPARALPILRRSSKLRASPLLNSTCGPSPGSGGVLQKRLGTVGVSFVTAFEECSTSTTVTLKSGTMLRGGEAHDHRRANRNTDGERTGSHRQRSAGVSGATRTDRTPLSASRGARAGRSFPDKLAERG